MNPHKKRYCWSAMAGLTTYGLALIVMYFDMHPATTSQMLGVIWFSLCPAVCVSAGINMKFARPRFQKYFWRMTSGMTAYVLGIVVMDHLYAPQSPCKYWLILLPVLPLIFVCFAIVRAVLEMDEMKRKIATEAMAFAGLATGFTCLSYIFVRQSGGPEIPLDWAFYLMWIYYGIGAFFSWRRYN